MANEKVKRSDGITFGRVLGTLILICVLAGLLFTIIFAVYIKTCIIPGSQLDLDDFTLKQSSTIWYQDDNDQWQELTTLSGLEKRKWVDLDEIPDYMEHALVAIEDHRFYKHNGVDWIRTGKAAVNMFTGSRTFGGSTITQQLIKNLTHQDDVTVQRKVLEIFQALEFEKKYDKDDILEWYLNVVYFGEGCYGVQTAAQTYFGKDVGDLSIAEAAAIVGITNLPTYYDPFYSAEQNKERQENVLWCMHEQGYITDEEYEEALAEELVFVRGENEPSTPNIHSYYTENVIRDVIKDLVEQKGYSEQLAEQLLYNGGYQIYCCMDKKIQNKVESIYSDLSKLPSATNGTSSQLQSGIVIMDQYTGNIVATVGGTGEKKSNFDYDRATQATRPSGSSIKPLSIYGPAVEYGLISPNTLVLDADGSKVSLAHAPAGWYPKNSPDRYDGVITIAYALQESKNTVAAQIIDKLTPSASFDFLKNRLNFTSLSDKDCSYAPLALGQQTWGVTVREMAQGFAALANDGVFTESRTYTLVKNSKGEVVLDNQPKTQVAFSQNTARVMTYMLNNAATYGTGASSRFGNMPVAGKTGTTTANYDRWFVGYTPYYTCAVWTGYDIPEYMSFSGNPAVTIWHDVMALVHEDLEYKDFKMSSGGSATGIFGTRDELEEQGKDEEEEPEEGEEVTPTDKPEGGEEVKPSEKPDTPSPEKIVERIVDRIIEKTAA